MRAGWETIAFLKGKRRMAEKRIEILAQIAIKKFTRQSWVWLYLLDKCNKNKDTLY